MTERLYYTDAYTLTFDAQVVEQVDCDGQPALVLDRSYFYPASGGQPHDTGQINGVPVIDVRVREADGAVLHLLAEPVSGPAVSAAVDQARRFDHMQHHTAQHILTRAFIETSGASTASFHLGSENVTIDLDCPALSASALEAAEALANAIVMQNLPVRAWFPAPEERAALELRKVPEVEGSLRVVQIGAYDATACGGTHVAQTGEIGVIKVLRTEKYKHMVRVEFICGGRALADYRAKHTILMELAGALTTGYTGIGAALEKLQAENRALRADLRAAREALLAAEAAELLAGATPVRAAHENGVRLITAAWESRDPAELRPLASRLVVEPGVVALLGLAGEKAQVIAARSADLTGPDMVAVLRRVTGLLAGESGGEPAGKPGTGRGGGRPDFAQGGGLPATLPALRAALETAAQDLNAGKLE